MSSNETRTRKVDVEKMDAEKVEELSEKIGTKVKDIVDKAVEDANKILNVYGVEAKMEISIQDKK